MICNQTKTIVMDCFRWFLVQPAIQSVKMASEGNHHQRTPDQEEVSCGSNEMTIHVLFNNLVNYLLRVAIHVLSLIASLADTWWPG